MQHLRNLNHAGSLCDWCAIFVELYESSVHKLSCGSFTKCVFSRSWSNDLVFTSELINLTNPQNHSTCTLRVCVILQQSRIMFAVALYSRTKTFRRRSKNVEDCRRSFQIPQKPGTHFMCVCVCVFWASSRGPTEVVHTVNKANPLPPPSIERVEGWWG